MLYHIYLISGTFILPDKRRGNPLYSDRLYPDFWFAGYINLRIYKQPDIIVQWKYNVLLGVHSCYTEKKEVDPILSIYSIYGFLVCRIYIQYTYTARYNIFQHMQSYISCGHLLYQTKGDQTHPIRLKGGPDFRFSGYMNTRI